jgi:hypothetical protein
LIHKHRDQFRSEFRSPRARTEVRSAHHGVRMPGP